MAEGGIVEGIRIDVVRLHETWMELFFPRQRTAVHDVLGKWKPRTRSDRIAYRLWAAVGVPVVALLYPLLLVGFAARFNARRLDGASTRLGLLGVVVLTAVVWGALTALAHLRLSVDGFVAVGIASAVAVVSAGLAVLSARVGGRGTTVALAYPFAMNAVFLPPVVAALYDPSFAGVLEYSEQVAVFLLDSVLAVGGLSEVLRERYSLEGIGVLLMWTGIATPLGWFLGCVVTLADAVRPRSDDAGEGGAKVAD